MKLRYKRVLLKLSGEALLPKGEGHGVGVDASARIVQEIAPVLAEGVQVAVVVGGGNILRGGQLAAKGAVDRAQADMMGMLATVINGIALQEACCRAGVEARLMTSLPMTGVAEPFFLKRALAHLEKGRLLILAGGTGRPFFTTDTAASLMGIELSAEALLKGTKVDGVYSADPKKNADATRYEKLSFMQVLTDRLKVMDATAISMCMDHNLPVVVFDFFTSGNFAKAVDGSNIGTVVYG